MIKQKSMNVHALKQVLSDNPAADIIFVLPSGQEVPEHFHITEIGRVQKDFIDCGGTKRSSVTCLLQIWLANDTHHRLDTTKLVHIITLAEPLLGSIDIPVYIEYDQGSTTQQFSLVSATTGLKGIILTLGNKPTQCLALANGGNSSCCTSKCTQE